MLGGIESFIVTSLAIFKAFMLYVYSCMIPASLFQLTIISTSTHMET